MIAAAAADGGDPLTVLLQYGVLGVFAVLLIIYAKSSITREQQRTERAEQQVQELNEFIRTELLPKQVEATLLHQQVAEVLGEAVELIAEIKIIDRNERRRGRE
jgi:hypothetical protein